MAEQQTYSYTPEHIGEIKRREIIFGLIKSVPMACIAIYCLVFRQSSQESFWIFTAYLAASIGAPFYWYKKSVKQASELRLTITEYKISLSYVAFTSMLKEIDVKEIAEVKDTGKELEVYSKFDYKPKPLCISKGFENFEEISRHINEIAARNNS